MRRFAIIGIFFISVFLFLGLAWAETFIKAEVDKTIITTDETITYKLIITSSDKKIPTPQLAKFEGFSILSQAQSQTMSLVKSDVETVLVYAFILAPINVGKFKIEPSSIKIKNEAYSTDTFEIEVKQGQARPAIPEKEKPSLPEKTQPEEPKITL